MRKFALFIATVAIGTGLVHLPSALLLWLTGGEFGWLGALVVTVAMPLTAWTICHCVGRWHATRAFAHLVPFALLFGIWIAVPISLIASAVLVSGDADSVSMIVYSLSSLGIILGLPFLASSYALLTGGLFGLVLASVVVWFPSSAWGDA